MKHYFITLFLVLSLSLNAQETATIDTPTQTELRSEISKKHDDGTKKQERFFNTENKKVKTINYYENGKTASVFTFYENEKNKTGTQYNKKTGEIDQKRFYYNSGKTKAKIYYETVYNSTAQKQELKPQRMYFYYENKKEKFVASWQYGTLNDIEYYNSEGHKIRNVGLSSKGYKVTEAFWYYGHIHGWAFGYDKGGNIIDKSFSYKGKPADPADYPEWEKHITEFDKIPALEKELDGLLHQYELVK